MIYGKFPLKCHKFAIYGKKSVNLQFTAKNNHENDKKAKYGLLRENMGHHYAFLWLKY